MKKIIISIAVLLAFSGLSFVPMEAGAPTCHPHPGGNYCNYVGKVKSAYINHGNTILMYFDTPMSDIGIANNVGFSIANSGRYAAAFRLNDSNKLFGNGLYSTLLTAVAANKTVTVQMRGTYGGYPTIDRIWIAKD